MRRPKLLYLILLFTFLCKVGNADTFIVINTNNTGPGSLRDALEQAERNGTAVTDFIHFNIPANRGPATIRVQYNQLLPSLSSNLVIDGTTQPGAPLGASSAKVTISLEGFTSASDYFYLFELNNLSHVSIFGLFLQSMVFDRATMQPPPNIFGILIRGGNNIDIGALNKGNVISGWSRAVFAEETPQTGVVNDLTVQGNIMGLAVDGITNSLGASGGRGPGGTIPAENLYGVYIGLGNGILIGGPQQALGNIIHSRHTDIYVQGQWFFGADTRTTISYNRLGIDRNGNFINTDAVTGIQIHRFFRLRSNSRPNAGLIIDHNTIGSRSRQNGILMDSVMSYFAIENNTIGAEVNDGPPPGGGYGKGIHLTECDIGIIGGENFGRSNTIRYCSQGALVLDRTSNITFRYNSTYCNKKRAIELNQWKEYNPSPLRVKPYVTVNYLNLRDFVMEGTAPPNSWVDLYYDDICPACEGFQHVGGMFAVIRVGPTGRWNYSDIPFGRGNFVVTATDDFGATSEYSAPILDTTELATTAALCKTQGGSVCGLKIVSGTEWEWLDQAGTRVGTDTCLTNVPPGRYFFRLSIGPAYCEEMYSFTVKDSILDIDSTRGITVTNTRCGRSNGSIRGFTPKNASRWQWEDVNGNVVSNDIDLENMAAGRYRFRVFNRACDTVTSFYEITDMTPRIDAQNVQITAGTCSKANGSITGLRLAGASFASIQWKDAAGTVVGTSPDLLNVLPGNYKLVLLDAVGGCGDSTALLNVPEIPGPQLNTTNAVITNASCDLSNGGINGIAIANTTAPVTFTWINEANVVVGNSLNMSNLPAGRYMLKMKDAGTCDTVISPVFEILNNGAVTLDATAAVIKPTGCTRINGSITGIRVTGATTVQWINTNNNAVVGTNLDLVNVPAGSYQLNVSDPVYGCTKQSIIYTVAVANPLPLAVTNSAVKHPACNTNNGSISINQFNNNTAGFSFEWLRDSITAIGNQLSINDLAPATYYLVATDSNGCSRSIFKQVITMQDMPVLNEANVVVSNDTCGFKTGAVVGITASSTAGNISYRWLNANNDALGSSRNLVGMGPGTYYLVISDINNCELRSRDYTISEVVTALPAPRYSNQVIPRNSGVTLTVENPVPGATYELTDAGSGQLIQTNTTGVFVVNPVTEDRQFSVRATAGPCSSAAAQVNVKVLDMTELDIPNAFSPNGDGINDIFRVKVTGYFRLDALKVYNRWGQLIFETRELGREWKGDFNGKPVPVATYYWIIEGLDVHGKKLLRSGSVTLLR
jgi:gliding motility-associated-like protein